MLAFTQMIDPVLSIAAALSVQSPFTSKAHSNYDAMVCVLRKPFSVEYFILQGMIVMSLHNKNEK